MVRWLVVPKPAELRSLRPRRSALLPHLSKRQALRFMNSSYSSVRTLISISRNQHPIRASTAPRSPSLITGSTPSDYSTSSSSASLPITSSNFTETSRKLGWETEIPDQIKERAEWVSWFKTKKLSKSACEISFSRSSGPGGQNVNKLNTKALIKLDLSDAMSTGKGWNRGRINGEEETEEIGHQSGWLLWNVGMRLIDKSVSILLRFKCFVDL